jgi:hypothetical protein
LRIAVNVGDGVDFSVRDSSQLVSFLSHSISFVLSNG